MATVLAGAAVLLLLLPWLNPFAPGPSASIEPWLVSFTCVLALRWLRPEGGLAMPLAAGLAMWAGWALLRSGASLDTIALAGGCVLVAFAAGFASRGEREQVAGLVALAWALAAALSTVIALLQYFGAAEALAPWVSRSADGDAYGNLRQRNQFACLCVIGIAALLWRVRRGPAPWWAWAGLFWLAVGAAATTSRTGLLQLFVLAALAAAWPAERRGPSVAAAGAALVSYGAAALLLPALATWAGVARPALWERVADTASCSSRRVLWTNVAELIWQKPLAGWGWGELDYAHFMNLYGGDRFCDILDNAHSLPLHLAVELGVPFLLLALAAMGWLVLRAAPWREAAPARQLAWSVIVLLGLHSLLEYPLWYGPFQLALGLCLGLLWPAGEPAPSQAMRSRALVLVALAATLYATWDYRRVSQIYRPAEERAAAWRDDTPAHIARSWLFATQARFALLTLTPLTRDNAEAVSASAEALLHYSPEPKLIEKAIESATMLERYDEALLHLARYRAAFPRDYQAWSEAQRRPVPGITPPTTPP